MVTLCIGCRGPNASPYPGALWPSGMSAVWCMHRDALHQQCSQLFPLRKGKRSLRGSWQPSGSKACAVCRACKSGLECGGEGLGVHRPQHHSLPQQDERQRNGACSLNKPSWPAGHERQQRRISTAVWRMSTAAQAQGHTPTLKAAYGLCKRTGQRQICCVCAPVSQSGLFGRKDVDLYIRGTCFKPDSPCGICVL